MKKTYLIATILSVLATSAFAQEAPQNNENFAQHKQQILDMMGKRESIISTDKSCVSAAQDKVALHKCMEAAKGSRQELRKEHQQLRQDRKEQRGERQEQRTTR